MKLSKFKYKLPEELIALHPAPNRDESRLLVLNRATRKIEDRVFKDIIEYFDDKEEFIEKVYDLLKPNGFLIILTKTSRSYWFGRTKIRAVLQKIMPFLFKYEPENLSKESKEKITLFKQKRVYPSKLKQLYKNANIQHKYHYPVIVRPPIFMRGKTEVPLVPPILEKPVLLGFTIFDKIVRMMPFASFFAEGFIMVGRKS